MYKENVQNTFKLMGYWRMADSFRLLANLFPSDDKTLSFFSNSNIIHHKNIINYTYILNIII